ncbi:hypothetical protein SCHPADRAFT_59009 [Schizopora paradoxa]|uniref:DUF6534 domain-containing protein n=1 Tax=Schizopora paradoxa TaxID=27342 RepID=A0A0H2S674_9AGAM|nr:hypothetical protein SCHPADRAFT_59009 [Schizopora paradoxa]
MYHFFDTIYYFMNSENDGKLVKGWVFILAILDSLHLAFMLHDGYSGLVTQFCDIRDIGLFPWSLGAAVATNVINDLIVRLFFLRRIWFLSYNYAVIAVLGVIISLSFAIGLYQTVITIEDAMNPLARSDQWPIFMTLGLTTLSDFCIAAVLCFYFRKSRKNHYEGTRSLLTTLIQYTIQTGLFATLFSIGSLVSFGLKPETDLLIVFYLPSSKIYVNALLASLNTRKSLREKSRVSKKTRRDNSNEDGLNSIVLSPRAQKRQAAAVKTPADSSISTEIDDNNAIAIQIQVEKDSPHGLVANDSGVFETVRIFVRSISDNCKQSTRI